MSRTLSLQRSKKLLDEQGFATWIVEKPYNVWSKRREDLFNLIDVIGIREDAIGVLGIQACGEDVGEHARKILEGFTNNKGDAVGPNPYLPIWLRAANRFFIWSWRLRKHKGTKDTYQLREIEFVLTNGIVEAREIPHE